MTKRVVLVCNHCDDTSFSERFIGDMAEQMAVSIDMVHEMLYDGHIWLEGAHAVRTDI